MVKGTSILIFEENGFPDTFHLHSLRHTAASLMISGGADVATVSGLLVHSQVSTIFKSSEKSGVSRSETGVFNSERFSGLTVVCGQPYTHPFDEKKREVSAQMQGRVGV